MGLWGRALAFVALAACSGPPPVAPAAVINATPGSVCAGDNFRTQIHLDSRGSAPQLTLVYTRPDPDAGDITYAWSFSGAVCMDGNPNNPDGGCDVVIDPSSFDPTFAITGTDVLFTMAGDRPVDVTLRVTNVAGGVTETHTTVTITPLDDAGTCPLP